MLSETALDQQSTLKVKNAHLTVSDTLMLLVSGETTFKTIYEAFSCFDMLPKTPSPYKVVSYEEIYL